MVRGCRVQAFLFVHSRSEPMWLTGGEGVAVMPGRAGEAQHTTRTLTRLTTII